MNNWTLIFSGFVRTSLKAYNLFSFLLPKRFLFFLVNQRIGTVMEVPNMNMITPAMKRQLMAMSGITDMKEFDEIVSKLGRAHTGYISQ